MLKRHLIRCIKKINSLIYLQLIMNERQTRAVMGQSWQICNIESYYSLRSDSTGSILWPNLQLVANTITDKYYKFTFLLMYSHWRMSHLHIHWTYIDKSFSTRRVLFRTIFWHSKVWTRVIIELCTTRDTLWPALLMEISISLGICIWISG